jgi:adenine-specific DNA methylase
VIAVPPNAESAKEYGAFYTRQDVAQFLVRWAVRSECDLVLDPSSGGGVFLHAAVERLRSLGADPARAVFGIELDPTAHAASAAVLAQIGLPAANLLRADFFSVSADWLGRVDAVVGNPPFIRFHQFSGPMRARAAAVMERQGVRVSELASSWTPFVVGGVALLREGGRLAMVVPMELCHAAYATPLLEFLERSFGTVHFLSFADRLFPQLSQETLLLLGENKGASGAEFRWRHFKASSELATLGPSLRIRGSRQLEAQAIATGQQRLVHQFLPARARGLYAELREHAAVQPLGAVAEVGIGYVTGANDFFHLSRAEARQRAIPAAYLRPAVCRGRAFTGLRFSRADWRTAEAERHAAYLLALPRRAPLPESVQRYVQHGEASGVHQAYKCRVRQPWHHVPHVHCPDGFLTYMSGISPRLVVNDAGAVAPNTLHVVRILPLAEVNASALAVSWRSSLTELSAELEGHALGGGMLKLEPREAARVSLALPSGNNWNERIEMLEPLARHAAPHTLRAAVDRDLLREGLGLTEADCRCLRDAAALLRSRRLGRKA